MAFGADRYANLRNNFAEQFEESGGRLVFRANGRGPALPVTIAERDAFISEYDRYLSRFIWRLLLLLIPAIILDAALAVSFHIDGAWSYVLILLSTAPFLAWSIVTGYRARKVPSVALATRSPIAAALSPEAARQRSLQRIAWPSLLLPIGYATYLVLRYHLVDQPLSAAHAGWAIASAGLVAISVVQAVRKWRFDREDTQVPL